MNHWARDFIGLKYKSNGVGPDEFNCWTLVAHIQQKIYGRKLPFFTDIDGDDWLSAAQKMRTEDCTIYGWQETDMPVDGDVMLLGHGRYATHAGVWVDGGLLHCLENAGVVFDRMSPLFRMEWPVRKIYTFVG